MWKRDVLFLTLTLGGVLALGANLMPPAEPRPATTHDLAAYQGPALREVVARVDASFRQRWKEKGLAPTAPATDLTVARRLGLGLMGTIPSLEEVRQFEYLPPDERLPWWIDHVLKDQRFSEYLAERLARAYVGTEGGPFIFYRRRRFVTWLGDQITRNTPYDALVRQLITAHGLWTNEPATNFITVTVRPDSKNQPAPVRLAGRVTRAFLGLRLDCAECHNERNEEKEQHRARLWKQSEFRGLAAFFGQTHLGFTGIHDGKGEYLIDDRKSKGPRTIEPTVPFAEELLPGDGTRRERLAVWVTHPKNRYFARAAVNRVWALLFGRPLVTPIDNLETFAYVPPALDLLADDFAANGHDLRRLIRIIASTEAYRLDSGGDPEPTEAHETEWAAFPMSRLRPEQVAGGVIQASSVDTIDLQSHVFTRLTKIFNLRDFLDRYGDTGEDEFEGRGGTIPQRLLLLNGQLTRERIKDDLLTATGRIAASRLDDARTIEAAYLTVLTRRPTAEEVAHFEAVLKEPGPRGKKVEDLFWALINSTEFSWNH